MGIWGTAILRDDFARDVNQDYLDSYDDGLEHSAIVKKLRHKYADALKDSEDAPIYWLALAKAQWECGALEQLVLNRVLRIIERGQGLGRWRERGAQALAKRKETLERFGQQIQSPNAKPRKRCKVRHYAPVYKAGDCLSIRLAHGNYGAAIVLAVDDSHRTEGMNLVGLLNYQSQELPTATIFQKRQWPRRRETPTIYWILARTYKPVAASFEIVGQTKIRVRDPQDANIIGQWHDLIRDAELCGQ